MQKKKEKRKRQAVPYTYTLNSIRVAHSQDIPMAFHNALRQHTSFLIALLLLSAAASFPPLSPARTLTTKMASLPTGTWTTVATLPPGTAGTIKQLQLWTSGAAPADILFRGFFDGAAEPQLGGLNSSRGTPGSTVALDVLLSSAFPANANYTGTSTWGTPTSGCNFFDPQSGVGGHFRLDMPFGDGFSLQLFNGGQNSDYWVIVTYIPLSVQPSPLRLFIKPFCVTNLASSVGTYPEFSLLSAASPNGVFLKGLKVFVEAPTHGISWAEGKFRFYNANSSAPPFPTNAVHEYSTGARNDLSWFNQQPGVEMVGSSSGGEDFFLSGFDWRGDGCFAHDLAGTVHCEFYGATISRVAGYRFYSEEGFAAPPGDALVASFTVNDQNFAVASSVDFFLGLAFYYA